MNNHISIKQWHYEPSTARKSLGGYVEKQNFDNQRKLKDRIKLAMVSWLSSSS